MIKKYATNATAASFLVQTVVVDDLVAMRRPFKMLLTSMHIVVELPEDVSVA